LSFEIYEFALVVDLCPNLLYRKTATFLNCGREESFPQASLNSKVEAEIGNIRWRPALNIILEHMCNAVIASDFQRIHEQQADGCSVLKLVCVPRHPLLRIN
jgi:hypothetical protein